MDSQANMGQKLSIRDTEIEGLKHALKNLEYEVKMK